MRYAVSHKRQRLSVKYYVYNYKVTRAALLIAAFACAVTAVFATIFSSCTRSVDCNFTFYYVCYDCPTDAVSASSISSLVESYGGAGYIVQSDGEYYVTVACYYDEKDAKSVAETLAKKQLGCQVLEVERSSFTLSASRQKYAEGYLAIMETLRQISVVLYDLANSVDNLTCDQMAAKAVLSDVQTTLEGLKRDNSSNCFAEAMGALVAECEDVNYGYILSRDVRRLQIAVCDAIINTEIY